MFERKVYFRPFILGVRTGEKVDSRTGVSKEVTPSQKNRGRREREGQHEYGGMSKNRGRDQGRGSRGSGHGGRKTGT